jgi:hypothetical protein
VKDDGGALIVVVVVGAGDVDGAVDLAKGDPKADAAVPWSPTFAMTGADVDGPRGEKGVFAFAASRSEGRVPIVPELLGTEEVDPKGEEGAPKAEAEPPNAEPEPKLRFPKTFGVVLRFANAEAGGGTELGAEGGADTEAGIEDPKAEAGEVPKAEVDELAPSITEGEGRTPKLFESHSVALGFSCFAWGCGSAGSSGSSTTIGSSSRKKASSSS